MFTSPESRNIGRTLGRHKRWLAYMTCATQFVADLVRDVGNAVPELALVAPATCAHVDGPSNRSLAHRYFERTSQSTCACRLCLKPYKQR